MRDMRIIRPGAIDWGRAGVAIAVLAVIVIAFGAWILSGGPQFKEGVQYEFKYTLKSTVPGQDPDGNEVAVATRQFVVDQTTMYPAAEVGLIRDSTLPLNTFVWQKKTQPELVVGDDVVREAYKYVEVRYHQANQEHQSIVPHLQRPQ